MSKKITEKIKFWGIVQGVGFRPYVAKIAQEMGIHGKVSNVGGLVEVLVCDSEKHLNEFVERLEKEKPEPAEIVHISRERLLPQDFDGFVIEESGEGEREVVMIPPDLALCDDCLREMKDENDVRHNHPFISCMACGPRYTIIDKIPYDRENTSMVDFDMCEMCKGQYEDINDRRYHAQTISCHDCGPVMKAKLRDMDIGIKTPLEMAGALLKEGRIIAFKSMGGYNLIANPFDDEAVAALRKIKGREKKPFALMFRNVDYVKNYCKVNAVEEKLLTSSARPIVLLEGLSEEELETIKPRNYDELTKSRFVGAFLPSMGAQHILLDMMDAPLIVTSANVSGMPIIKDEEEIFALMDKEPLLAGVFYNDREIRVSVDDSVVRVVDRHPQIIRRSKGYVPLPLFAKKQDEVLATGGQLKNSFVLAREGFVYPSQFFGDMDTLENQKIYKYNEKRMEELLRIKPKKVICDLHPNYFTTEFAKAYAKEHGLPLIQVQHHHAHVASVMAENDIEDKVIGVSFDGTGYGTDGAIWGGEFMLCEGGEFERISHLKYANMIGGDKSMKDAWKSALSFIHATDGGNLDLVSNGEILVDIREMIKYSKDKATLEHREIELTERAIDSGLNVIRSSSMGRLFDGVAAMLGICDYNSYEGQCATLLEAAAARSALKPGHSEVDDLAMMFHLRIADLVCKECIRISEKYGVDKVALTGGVFQNGILMEKTLKGLRTKGLKPYYNISVSPNDGGIALGQAYIGSRVSK